LRPRPDAGARARPLRRGGSPRLPVLRHCVGHLRGRGCADRGAPRLGQGLRPLPLPRGAHVRGFQGLPLQLPCVPRACRPVGVRDLRDCTCIWIHFGIQQERLWTNHAGVGCRLVSAPRGVWICRGCGLLPASGRWSSGSNDVATCGGIDISGGNGRFCNRGCGDIWYARDSLRYDPSSLSQSLEGVPGGQESTITVLLRRS
uniref:Uncharacterized protein n=1 Tax=Aegilops tauschii subsp. strangulata TaxID=200361 RepID=A0A453ARR8_AEGTS